MSNRKSAFIAFLFVALSGPASRADDLPGDPNTEIARRHYETGIAYYEQGRLTDALREMETAYRLRPLPDLAYNIGRCHEKLGNAREAADAYERYLSESPTAPDAERVRGRVVELRKQAAADTPAPVSVASLGTVPIQPVPAPTEAPPPAPSRRRVATWVAGGAGVALIIGGVAAQAVANGRLADLRANCAADGVCGGVPNAQQWVDEGRGASIAAPALIGVGVAALAAGVVLYFVEGRRPATAAHAWRIVPVPGGIAFAFGGGK